MRDMRIVILLLFLMKAALAAPSVYIVTGIGWGEHDGVYEEKREPELHYKQLGDADKYGNYYFLYTDSRFPKTWILGRGIDLATVYAHYRAPAKDGRPMVTQWRYVHDWSREGKEQGDPKPSLRVVGVETNSTGEEFQRQLEGGEDLVTEEYIICDNSDLNQPRMFISKDSVDPNHCDGVLHCKSRADELCPFATIRDKSKSASLWMVYV